MRIPCWTHTYYPFFLPLHSFWTSIEVAKGKADICRSLLVYLLLKSLFRSGCLWWTFIREPNMLILCVHFQVDHPHHFPQSPLSPILWSLFQISEYPVKLLATGSVQATFSKWQLNILLKVLLTGKISFLLLFRATSQTDCCNISITFD